jgi:hypothetical protein
MQQKAYAGFGYIVVQNNLNAGETGIISEPVFENVFSVGESFPYIWLYTKGTDVLVNVDTQGTITRTAGQSTVIDPFPIGTWRTTLPEALEFWCISGYSNLNKNPPLPNVSIFALLDGQQAVVPHGTRLFLASGALEIGSSTIPFGKQIAIT